MSSEVETPLAGQIAETEVTLARLELELARSGGDPYAHRAVEAAERHLSDLRSRVERQERLERAQERERSAAREAVKARAATVKRHAATLGKEREGLAGSRDRADRAVREAREAVRAAGEALREHSGAVQAAAGRLEGLGVSLADEHGNRFEQGARTELGVSVVVLGGESFRSSRLGEDLAVLRGITDGVAGGLRPAPLSGAVSGSAIMRGEG